MTDQVLHLVVPGLLGPMSGLDASDARFRFPTLERWLVRADRFSVPAEPEALLFKLFGLTANAGTDLPTAALCYLADSGQAPTGVVFHATPVHLRPDQDRLLLFDTPAADLAEAESADFVAAFNEHFAADGWRLTAPTAGRWYLHVDSQPDLVTHPLGEVIGRNIDLFQPQGEDAGEWQQRLNEVQMLFHGLAVNQAREARGRLPVSGLWLHGGGRLPEQAGHPLRVMPPATPLLNGLSCLGDPLGGESLRWLEQTRRAVWDADLTTWLNAVTAVEAELEQVAGQAVLYPGDGFGYRYGPAQRRRLWRRPRPLAAGLLAQEPV